MMKTFKFPLVMILASLLLVFGCKEEEETEEFKPQYFIDSEELKPSVKISAFSLFLESTKYADIASKLEHDVTMHKITYKTEFEGDTIEASGVVFCPDNSKSSFDMISYQHGTIFTKADAPSVFLSNLNFESNYENEAVAGIVMASMGNIVVMSDYIGFGESSDYFHPYMHKEYTNNAVLDMIRSSKEFVKKEESCNTNKNLFLLGYSQGASATVSALSAIENNSNNSDIDVKAAAAGSGAYDLIEFRKSIFQAEQKKYDKPSFILYLLESFKTYSNMNIDYSDIFSEKFADDVKGLIDGNKNSAEIDKQMTTYVGELFNDDFQDNDTFISLDSYENVRKAFSENSISAWNIETPLNLYYSYADEWIFDTQSSSLSTKFQSSKVTLKPFEGLDHTGAFFPTIAASLEWFDKQ
ncbi:MAG: prolyl oligopeptidase family serine peptidase [Prolixibacteraceae bacterium]|nr:prolyl oligopeptidase family serine peptidase [Prolixibacteraceae bacterium]